MGLDIKLTSTYSARTETERYFCTIITQQNHQINIRSTFERIDTYTEGTFGVYPFDQTEPEPLKQYLIGFGYCWNHFMVEFT